MISSQLGPNYMKFLQSREVVEGYALDGKWSNLAQLANPNPRERKLYPKIIYFLKKVTSENIFHILQWSLVVYFVEV